MLGGLVGRRGAQRPYELRTKDLAPFARFARKRGNILSPQLVLARPMRATTADQLSKHIVRQASASSARACFNLVEGALGEEPKKTWWRYTSVGVHVWILLTNKRFMSGGV